ncbi:MAG TPA: dihydrofolate reductase family protein [Streptosporangiaceae bacterium]|jgi:riboflavin biosynthesis pyrimidine reductase
MHRVWPPEQAGPVDAAGLEELYGYPGDRPWLVVNFVSSADGAVEVAGTSRGLTNAADRQVYPLSSDLADVRLVGGRTAVVEGFRGVRPGDQDAELRKRHGLAAIPPIAVVTTGRTLPADAPVITDVLTPTIVVTCESAPEDLRREWAAAGAEVLVAGARSVDFTVARAALAERGLCRVHCDGGPHLFGSLLAAGVVDELRLTVAPLLVSGVAGRIAEGAAIDPARLRLASVLTEDDTLVLRYLLVR